MNDNNTTRFAPHLTIPGGVTDISFYELALGAVVLRRFNDEDGTLHVAELSIDQQLFHLHEEKQSAGQFHPGVINGTTVLVGIFVADVDVFIERALGAGAELISPAQSYDYGYRQAEIKDPFGHIWLVEMTI